MWQEHIQADGIKRAIMMGKVSYLRTCWRITPSYLPNHKSWEVDVVKVKLGQKMAAYFIQGAAEAVLAGHRSPPSLKSRAQCPRRATTSSATSRMRARTTELFLSGARACLRHVTWQPRCSGEPS